MYLTQTNNTSPCPNEKLNLLQVGGASYSNQVLTPPACKFLCALAPYY